jgi:hypothetical protein
LFVKRPGENKYDYPITDEQLRLYGVPVGDEVVLTKVECYFDMDFSQIVILMEGEAKMDTPDYHPIVATLTLELTDVGTTVVEVPLQSAKESIHQQIQEWADARIDSPYFEAAFPQSKQAFFNLVDGYLMQIANATTFLEFLTISQGAEQPIANFAFEYDFMVFLRAQRLIEINGHLDWQCSRATTESCQAMRAYFEASKSSIQGAQDSMAIQTIVSQIYSGIQERFVIDPVVMLLEQQKTRSKENLDSVFEVLAPYFPDFSTRMDISMLVSEFKWKIDQAATVEAIDQAYQDFYASLLAKNIVWKEWSLGKTFLLAQIEQWGVWIVTLMEDGYLVAEEVRTRYDQFYADLTAMDELVPLIRLTIEAYGELEASLMPLIRTWGFNTILTIATQNAPRVPASMRYEFDQMINQSNHRIQQANGPWDIQDAVDDLVLYIADLPVDDWQSHVDGAIQLLQATLDQLLQDAPELASQQAMNGLFLIARSELVAAVVGDESALMNTVDKWQDAIMKAYFPVIPNYDQFELDRWRTKTLALLDKIYFTTKDMVTADQSLSTLDLWRTNYITSFAASTTVSQVLGVQQDALNAWLALSFSYKADFEAVRQDFIAFVDAANLEAILYLGDLPSQLATSIANVRSQLTNQTNPQYLIMTGASAMNNLPYSIRIAMQDAYFVRLQTQKDAFAMLVATEHLALLENLYSVAFARINRAWSSIEVFNAYNDFEALARLLPKDEFVLAKQFAMDQVINRYAQLWQTATDDSRMALASVMQIAQGQIVASQTHAELNAVLTAVHHALDEAYVMNAELWQIMIYRQYYIDIGQKITESVMLYAMNEELDHLMMMTYFQLVDQWKIDTDPADMFLHYQEWIQYLNTLQYTFVQPLADLVPELRSALWVDYDFVLSQGLAGNPETVDLIDQWIGMLNGSATPIDAIANRHMGATSVVDKAYEILYDRAVTQLQTHYFQYQMAVSLDSQPLLDEIFDTALLQLRLSPNRFNLQPIIDEFHQKASALQ